MTVRSAWPSRQKNFGPPASDAVFPIPPIPCPPLGTGTSVDAKRRRGQIVHPIADANFTLDCLNELYGCDGVCIAKGKEKSPNASHRAIHQRLLATFKSDKLRPVHKPRAAAKLLLGSRMDYGGDDTTVEAYESHRVSLPSGRVKPVALSSVLPAKIQSLLSPDNILADADVVEERLREEPVQMYTDEVLKKDPEAMEEFLGRLARCGILGATCNPKGRVSPFFVKKENNKLRLFWIAG